MGLEIPILGEYRGRIEILSTHILFCLKFAAVCQIIATSAPATFYTHNIAECNVQ